jgi:ArsR family transcriptional regulator, arsenate/arsenite/antimonite-responsive transcriptional repressor
MKDRVRLASSIASTFEAFADPTRREILTLLAEREYSATELADAVGRVGRTAVSSHLRILRSAGLVNERREGRYRFYSINPAPADEAVEFLRSLYRSSLSMFKTAARVKSADKPARRKWANSS